VSIAFGFGLATPFFSTGIAGTNTFSSNGGTAGVNSNATGTSQGPQGTT
jgi:hypothetical protein